MAGECGESIVNLIAYDNTQTALQNFNDGAWEQGLYIYPGESYDHDNDATTPNIIAQNNDYPGTGITGVWTVVNVNSACGGTYAFSNPSNTNVLGDPRASFTADPGTYTLRWTLSNGCFDDVEVTIDSCQSLDFDGTDDYISFEDNYDVSNQFSIEAWVKPEAISSFQTIISKRDANNLATGYDLRLSGSTLSFNWNATGSIQSPYPITTSRCCLLYTSPSPRDKRQSRMPSSA